MNKHFFQLLLLTFIFGRCLPSFYSNYIAEKAYTDGDYEKVVNVLERDQIENPNDPLINYNLGTAFYKLNKFDRAKSNLQRSVENCNEKQNDLKEKGYFNWGNSLYKNCLNMIGSDWEKKDLEKTLLDNAISEVNSSIEKFNNCLVLNSENKRAENNKKQAEELLKKLMEKKQQQEKKEQQQKQDKQDQEDQKDQNQKKGDQGADKDEQQDQDKKDDSEKDDQKEGSPEKNKENDKSDKQKNRQKDESENGRDYGKDGENYDSKNKKKNEKEQDIDEHNKNSLGKDEEQKEPDNKDGTQGQKENQDLQKDEGKTLAKGREQDLQKQNLKEKGMAVVLDKLQSDEAELQKKVIFYKTKGTGSQLDKGQKPW